MGWADVQAVSGGERQAVGSRGVAGDGELAALVAVVVQGAQGEQVGGVAVDAALQSVIGPAMDRLTMRFADRVEAVDRQLGA